MNRDDLERLLFEAVRKIPPDDRVPPGFERRVLARLRERAQPDLWGSWALALWRAAASCVLIVLLVGLWTLSSNWSGLDSDNPEITLEQVVLAPFERADEIW